MSVVLPQSAVISTFGAEVRTTVTAVRRRVSDVGAVVIDVDLRLERDEVTLQHTTRLTGSVYGEPGPVACHLATGVAIYVVNAGRFGETFDEQWAVNFTLNHEVA